MNFNQFLSDNIKKDASVHGPSKSVEQRLRYVMGLKSSVHGVQRNSLLPLWFAGLFGSSALAGKLAAVSIIFILALSYRHIPNQSSQHLPADSTKHQQLADSLWQSPNIQWEDSVLR